MAIKKRIITHIFHPEYRAFHPDWQKFRLTFEGGKAFVYQYLKKFSLREDTTDFATRQLISYCPAHAKAAIIDIRNAIYQRLIDIQRIGGPDSYQKASAGENGGVNKAGMAMTTFIGNEILQELLTMAKVGIFIDKDDILARTKRDSLKSTPYLYFYPAEDIQSWTYENNILTSVLLRDFNYEVDSESGLISGTKKLYRLLKLVDNGVEMSLYSSDGSQMIEETQKVSLSRIPLVIGSISQSLLIDVADYQIALLNLESSDIAYSLKSNFPFYTEQFNPQFVNLSKLQLADNSEDGTPARENVTTDGTEDAKIGATHGRFYAKGLERPAFINPSAEPLRASMEKASQLKEDIRKLVNLSLKNLERPAGSQSSDLTDEKGLEAGLSYVGMELERIEKEIANIWAEYENSSPAIIKYPKKYSLRTDKDRLDEVTAFTKIKESVPSKTFQKEMDKQIVITLLETRVPFETLETIKNEVDEALVTITDHEIIREDHKEGLVSTETASLSLGYPEGEAEKAKVDHAERAARIVEAQIKVANRGTKDLQNLEDDVTDKIDKDRRGGSDDND
jgi:hypothetical protein